MFILGYRRFFLVKLVQNDGVYKTETYQYNKIQT